MANEILTSTLGDILASEILSGVVELALADRGALPNHPALIEIPNLQGAGSTSVQISTIGLMGYDLLVSTAEGTDIVNTALVDSSVNITIGKYGKVYEASTMGQMLDATGKVSAQSFAMDAVASGMTTLLNIIANLVDNFATVKGTSGINASFQNYLDCLTALEVAKVRGPYLGILHAQQWADIRSDVATNSGGSIQWNIESQTMLSAMKGLGYKGNFLGADIMTTTQGLDDATDVWGGIFGRGALAYGWAAPLNVGLAADQVVLGGKFLFERERDASNDLTEFVTHMYAGAIEVIDLAGVTLRTDAP